MMKTTDRFLLGIVIGIVLLVGIAFAVAFLRPEPTFVSDDTPEGVVHNYLLAIRQREFDRAYTYMAPTIEGYPPSAGAFSQYVQDTAWEFRLDDDSISLDVVSARITGDRAIVSVRESWFYQGGLFNSGQSTSTFEMQLQRDASSNDWKIVEAGRYWSVCWTDRDACP